MKVAVFGSYDWSDYMDLARNITLLIQESHKVGHSNIVFVHGGKNGAENMVTEYIGKTEKFLRQKGYKIKEELIRDRSSFSDVTLIESTPDFALVFGMSTRNKQALSLLETYGIPHRYIKE